MVFWYDDAADFAEDIDSMELENAKVCKLTKDILLYSKRFYNLEIENFNEENILIGIMRAVFRIS